MKNAIYGNEMDRMPNWAFKIMAFTFNIADFVKSPGRRLDAFGIRKGQTVVDWGCGTGRYLKQASELVGEKGTVYAVDIHQLAFEAAAGIAKRFNLKNIHPVLTDGITVSIPPQSVDVLYALDMFHMVKDSNGFLKELCRIIKVGGVLILEDGHQPRALSKNKVNSADCWEIVSETKAYLKCKPINRSI